MESVTINIVEQVEEITVNVTETVESVSVLVSDIPAEDGISPTIGMNGNWFIGDADTGVKAEGIDGEDGIGITSIELQSTEGLNKTYRITFTNATIFDFVVSDGAPGEDFDPQVVSDVNDVKTEITEARGDRSALKLRLETISNFASPNALGYVVGAWITNSFHGTNLGNLTGAINRIEVSPFYYSEPFRVDSIGVSVTTASTTGTASCRVVIYSDVDGFPDELIYSSEDLNTSTTGAKQVACDLTLDSGRQYWIGVHWDSAAGLRGIPTANAANLGLSGNHSNAFFNKLRRTSTYADGAPATWGYANGHRTTGSPPAVIMRLGPKT